MLNITPQHRNTARQDLAGVCEKLAQDARTSEETPQEEREKAAQSLERQARAILAGTLHTAKVDVLARAYALEDYSKELAAQCDQEMEALDAPEEADEDE